MLVLLLVRLLRSVSGLLSNRCRCGGNRSGLTLLGCGFSNNLVNWRLKDGDSIRKRLLRTDRTLGIPALHARRKSISTGRAELACYSHLDLDTEDTLSEHDVPDGVVNEVFSGLTGVDHETIGELHGLGASSTELARDDNFATLGTRFHDETEDTIASTKDPTLDHFSQ